MTFSIVCLTYKRSKLLEESIYSVLNQTLTDWELLVINDNPLQTFHYNHPKVKIFNLKEKFSTLGDKRNFGLRNVNADLVLQLDDDDFLLPDYLQNLHDIIKNHGWLCAQKPILYYDDIDKVVLSPTPQYNTFLYRRESIQGKFEYPLLNYDELTPFYKRVTHEAKTTGLYSQLKPSLCGYVYRQNISIDKRYAMSSFKEEPLSEQDSFLNRLDDITGDITLVPKWSKDYVHIIRSKMEIPKIQFPLKNVDMEKILKESKEETSKWNKVQPTWENAKKFLSAAKSRGLIATALDFIGINNNSGDRVSDEILEQRKLSCFGNEKEKIAPCRRLIHAEGKGYFCGGCGCGNSDLARLDADSSNEYTKLHYPQLECPLKKRGFFNEEKLELQYPNIPLSIIIPVLNDNEELNLTIQSIRNTSPKCVEIIVIDDASDKPAIVNDKDVKLIRLEKRQGVGSTRHLGAKIATTDYLLFIDSHMRFDPKWYINGMNKLSNSPVNTVWCATCLGLEEGFMELDQHKGAYYGAKLVLYDEKERDIFEGKWIPEKEGDDYEISCLMGACYFFHKKWFFHIGGTKSLTMWGSDEPLLSTKTLLAGGTMRVMKDVKIGHKFRNNASYTTDVSYVIYNKLRSMKTVFSKDLYEMLSSKISDDANKQAALTLLKQHEQEIKNDQDYYKSIFIHDDKWLQQKLNNET